MCQKNIKCKKDCVKCSSGDSHSSVPVFMLNDNETVIIGHTPKGKSFVENRNVWFSQGEIKNYERDFGSKSKAERTAYLQKFTTSEDCKNRANKSKEEVEVLFELKYFNNDSVLIVATSWFSLFSLTTEIEEFLISINYFGVVYFDNTLAHGLSNRFFKIDFDGKNLVFSGLVSFLNKSLEKLQDDWLENNTHYFKNSGMTCLEKLSVYERIKYSNARS